MEMDMQIHDSRNRHKHSLMVCIAQSAAANLCHLLLDGAISEGSVLGPMCFIMTLMDKSVFAEKKHHKNQVEGHRG